MQRSVTRFAAPAAVVLAAVLAGCGPTASAPDPKPVSSVPTEHNPAAPQLPAHHPPGAVFVLDLTDRAAVRPSTVEFASHGTLERMQWRNWGGSVADGRGTAQVRICTPDCVHGHTASYPATVSLGHPASCFGAHFYGDSSIVVDTTRGRQKLASFIRNPC